MLRPSPKCDGYQLYHPGTRQWRRSCRQQPPRRGTRGGRSCSPPLPTRPAAGRTPGPLPWRP
eukprot:scaffold48881_cov63-Phaeocystis_antarctica.AAC.5